MKSHIIETKFVFLSIQGNLISTIQHLQECQSIQ